MEKCRSLKMEKMNLFTRLGKEEEFQLETKIVHRVQFWFACEATIAQHIAMISTKKQMLQTLRLSGIVE